MIDELILQTITQAITQASNFLKAISITLRQVCETVGWNYGEAWIPDEQNKILKLSPSCYISSEKLICFREASQQFSFSPKIGIPGRVWGTKKFEWVKDVTQQQSKLFLRNEFAYKIGLKTALGVPIIANDVLLVGKADAGKLRLNPSPINIWQFCFALARTKCVKNSLKRSHLF